MRVTLFDYGAGNLHSLAKALETPGVTLAIQADPAAAADTDLLVLPGVGAFGPAAAALAPGRERLRDAVAGGLPCVGICLGMQLLFEESEEHGTHRGLGLLPGRVVRLPSTVKVPHVGWNQAVPARPDPLFEGLPAEPFFYFDQSYCCLPAERSDVLAETDYGLRYACAAGRGRVYGVQFHPEKSQADGLRMLKNFVELP